MSLLDFNTADIPDLAALPAGAHQLEVISAEVRKQKPEKGSSNFLYLRLVPTEDPNAKDIGHTLMLPDANKDERENNNRLRRLKEFFQAFGVQLPLEYDADDNGCGRVETMTGLTGMAVLALEENEEYGEQNRVTRFLIG